MKIIKQIKHYFVYRREYRKALKEANRLSKNVNKDVQQGAPIEGVKKNIYHIVMAEPGNLIRFVEVVFTRSGWWHTTKVFVDTERLEQYVKNKVYGNI